MEHKWTKQKSAAKIPPAAPHHRPPNNLLEREAARPGLDDGGADVRPAPGRWIAPGLMEAVMTGRITAMGQRKYSLELRERATRMALEARADPDRSRGAVRRIAEELGIHPEALRTWVRQAEIDRGDRPGATTDEARRIRELEKEVRELRRANAILRSASAFFAAELDRPSR